MTLAAARGNRMLLVDGRPLAARKRGRMTCDFSMLVKIPYLRVERREKRGMHIAPDAPFLRFFQSTSRFTAANGIASRKVA